MMLAPVPRDINPPRHPYTIILLDVIEETLQRTEASRAAQQPAMHADGQHFRRFAAFFVKYVERVAQVSEKLLGRVETLRRGETHVIGVERVRHDQLRHLRATADLHVHPEWQVVAV